MAIIRNILLSYLCVLHLSTYAQKAGGNPFKYIDVNLTAQQMLYTYDRYSADTQLSIWVKYKLIRPKQVAMLHKLYPGIAAQLYFNQLKNGRPLLLWGEDFGDGMCPNWKYDPNVLSALLKVIAKDKPDSIEWLCNVMLDSSACSLLPVYIPGKITYFGYISEVLKVAETDKILLAIEKCFSMLGDEVAEDPVSGGPHISGPASSLIVSYLLSLKNEAITERLKQKVTEVYKNGEVIIKNSEEYQMFLKHGVKL